MVDAIVMTRRATVDYATNVATKRGVDALREDGNLVFRKDGEVVGNIPIDDEDSVSLHAVAGILLAREAGPAIIDERTISAPRR